jgi:hypoxanthine phosphoribosyltransferase
MSQSGPTSGAAPVKREARPWKGLDTNQMPVFIGYDQVERMIAALLETASAWHPDEVVGIARGGLVPAAMAAGILALPLSFVGHDPTSSAVTWIGPPASGRRILLVDDCCSSGNTLHRTRSALCEAGHECLTLVIVHDPDTVRHIPDLSHPMRALFRLPWERGEATPTGRAAKASGTRGDPGAEAPFVALGVDETFLIGLATHLGEPAASLSLPRLPPKRALLISGIAESGRMRLSGALSATPYRDLPLECRPDTIDGDKNSVARFKAETATRWGCTHIIEWDAEQAIRISAHAPHLIVTWRPIGSGHGWTVGAATRSVAVALEIH